MAKLSRLPEMGFLENVFIELFENPENGEILVKGFQKGDSVYSSRWSVSFHTEEDFCSEVLCLPIRASKTQHTRGTLVVSLCLAAPAIMFGSGISDCMMTIRSRSTNYSRASRKTRSKLSKTTATRPTRSIHE